VFVDGGRVCSNWRLVIRVILDALCNLHFCGVTHSGLCQDAVKRREGVYGIAFRLWRYCKSVIYGYTSEFLDMEDPWK
jgi:hypothetical protein